MQNPPSAHRWAILRIILGAAQILVACLALGLLLRTGFTTPALAAVVLTCLCTSFSVLLFGAHRQK